MSHVGPMRHAARPGRLMGAALASLALSGPACAARHMGPVPSGAPTVAGASETTILRSGNARVRLTSPVRRRFDFRLQPSAVYSSPPARLQLAYGARSSGEGVDLQLPPALGTIRTSPDAILTLDVRLPGAGLLQLTSLDGECAVTLDRLSHDAVAGHFVCGALHPDVRGGPGVSAVGAFEARR